MRSRGLRHLPIRRGGGAEVPRARARAEVPHSAPPLRAGRLSAYVFAVLLLTVLVAAVLAPAALAYRMDVPAWKQGDSRWATLRLDGSPYTMARSGCAVTSCAMVAAYFGSSKDPGGLCKALNANGGLDSQGRIYWDKVPSAAGGSIRYVGRYDYCSLTRINQELDAGYPVIVRVYRSGTHWVVITGRDGSTYYINDPADGARSTLNSRYGSPGSAIKAFRVYRGTKGGSGGGTDAGTPTAGTRYQQSDSRLAYTGAWTLSSTSSASGGSFRYANSSGASVTAQFNGTHLAWIAKTSPVYGLASVSVDGGPAQTVDLYSATTAWRKKVWDTGILSTDIHRVTITWTGSKNPAATNTNIGVDAFDVVGSLLQASPLGTRYEQGDSRLAYTGYWIVSSTTSASGGSFRYANGSGAAVTATFDGTYLAWIAKKSPVYGKARVIVDGGAPVTVDLYSASTLWRNKVWDTGPLAPGLHTVRIEWTGTKNPAATNTNIGVDAFDVQGSLAAGS